MSPKGSKRQKGFTLIELLIVIGIIGFLAGAVLVAVDPVKRIQSSRDAQRWSEVDAILNAVLTWQVDNLDDFRGDSTDGVAEVSTLTLTGTDGTYGVTIDGNVVSPVTFNTDLTTTAALLRDAINADSDVNTIVTATSSGAVVTLTEDAVGGGGFTAVESGVTLTADVAVAETVTAVQTLVDTDANTRQIIVSDITGVDCATPANAPACPDSGGTIPDGTNNTTDCIADFGNLAPEYLSEIPTDPTTGVPVESPNNSAIGVTNSGYYVNKLPSGRFTVGACYGEQANNISVQR